MMIATTQRLKDEAVRRGGLQKSRRSGDASPCFVPAPSVCTFQSSAGKPPLD
jgi:hypothetical protein